MPGDLVLLIDHRDTTVTLDGQALRIERPGRPPHRVPLGPLGSVIVHGSPLVSCDVWRALAEAGVPAALLPGRGRGEPAHLGAGLNASVALRARQHAAALGAQRVDIARALVADKLSAQRALLRESAERWLVEHEDCEAAIGRRWADLASAADVSTVMGLEGAGAAAWFRWLGGALPSRWRFQGRNRRPPRDPVNALLSLGYTLLEAEMRAAVQAAGFDPALGFLHDIAPARAALVLDLMEPLRPSVDALAIQVVEEVLDPRHFTYSQTEGCRLNKTGRRQFYAAFAEAREDWWQPQPAAAPVSLASACWRQVQWLRVRLGEPAPAGDPALLEDFDG
ncbi:MAG: CRISPR-associated endonuclease Cas1 [Betaproteobacteria bacterium]|nr:CRISPR-associated endonuclease Cas1 [Betaproteobacteria bacterium]